MGGWWESLSALNRAFYVIAVFFSTLFIWQLISAVGGLGEEEELGAGDVEAADGLDVNADADADADDLIDDAAGLATFRLFSVRSIVAFCTLFAWAGALYLNRRVGWAGWALLRAALWGAAGTLVVALFFWFLPRLTEEGTANLDTAMGRTAEVYLRIPEDGVGRVKVIVSGALKFVPARARNGQRLEAGTMVRVVGRADESTLEVEEAEV